MRRAIGREIGHVLTGLVFLTRLPVPVRLPHEPDALARAARWFPLVGALIGAIVAAVFVATAAVLPPAVAAGLAIVAGLLLTGALHEDGLADCCDGLGGGATRERSLEIMRDSRIGTYGTAALIASIGLRWAALSSLTPAQAATALIVGHGVSRGMIAPAMALARPARTDGLAASSGGVRASEAAVALLLSALLALLAGPVCGALALAAALVAGGAMLAILVRRLGGHTGDGLGAVQQAAEVAVLVALAGCLA